MAVSFLEFANLTVPTLVQKIIPSAMDKDPFWKRIKAAGMKRQAVGPKFRFRRVKDVLAEPTEITETQLTVNLNRRDIFDYVEGDWPKIVQPIVMPHQDRDRLTTPAERKMWMKNCTKAAALGLLVGFKKRMYNGSGVAASYKGFMSLNGGITDGTRAGFENGLLRFEDPSVQTATWLGLARSQDADGFNNWYTQYKQHNGIGVDFIDAVREVKAYADSFGVDDSESPGDSVGGVMSLGLMDIPSHLKLSTEVRTTPSGSASVVYTVDDIAKGKAMPNVEVAAGVTFFSNRWISASTIGVTEPCYLLTPESFEWWTCADYDMKATPIFDGMQAGNYDADIGYIIHSQQMACVEPLRNGCVGQ